MTLSQDAPETPRPVSKGWWVRILLVAIVLAVPAAVVAFVVSTSTATARQDPKTPKDPKDKPEDPPEPKRQVAPEFPEKMDWLNTAGPITLKDLKGKVVILDFWTLCCINCIHILPDLAKLEKKYPNELVVIGVHSAKFENEKDTKSIRKAVLRYEIAHPVVNDADHKIWDAFDASSWPTFVVIDTEGKIVGGISGEGNYDVLDKVVGKIVEEGKKNKTLNEKPIRFDLVRFRETGDTPLFFPGKLLADAKGKRLFIADSTHHRIVVTDLAGTKQAIIGTGAPGYKNGKYDEAQFDDPQGLALIGETLYVADRKNHSIRAIDLTAKTVTTVAGTGKQAADPLARLQDRPSDAATTALNSPWDIYPIGSKLYIAMAGHHQIWLYDPAKKEVQLYAGDGRENIKDGPLYAARFAQPSGLTSDGKFLYVADSEVSAVRKVPLDPEGRVSTLVGSGLFDFGDKDGIGEAAKIQHALGITIYDGKLLLADTYNSKLKTIDPKTSEVKTLNLKPAIAEKGPLFDEPGAISIIGDTAYVADTNAHRIRVVDMKKGTVSTLTLTGVEPPPPQKEWLPPKK